MTYRDVIKVATKQDGFDDLTKQLTDIVGKSKIRDGLCNAFLKGTTAALLINENDRMLIEDIKKTAKQLIPDEHIYQHPDNAPSHLRAALLGQQLTIPVADAQLTLGTWQSVLLFELDNRDREREIIVTVNGA